ncbi:MAG: Fe-S cluster assembly protein SufD [Nitrospinaceae bacterium]
MSSVIEESKNGTESTFIALHKQFLDTGQPSSDLLSFNKKALDRFERLKFPHRKHEMYTFVNTKDLTDRSFSLKTESAVQKSFIEQHIYAGCERSHLTFVDGVLHPELSDATALGTSVKIGSLVEAVKDESFKSILQETIEQENDVFASINSAFMKQGVMIRVSRDKQIEVPLQILNVSSSGDSGPVMTVPRSYIHLEPLSELKLIVKYVGNGGNYFVNSVQDMIIEDNATLTHIQVEADSTDAWHFSKNRVRLKRDSRYVGYQTTNGARLVRNHNEVWLSEPGAEMELNGVSVLEEDEQSHQLIRVHHEVENCTSRQYFKNIINDRARASFDGTVVVNKGAQLTNSDQLINNLMLSDEGHADCKPNLMIFADDVKCAHGATVGQLDESQLFYLKTRGLSESVAKEVLTQSFARSIVQKIPFEPVVKELDQTLLKKLKANNE